jgi:CheY-like chemotaxis protein/signal transduction histidine kinase
MGKFIHTSIKLLVETYNVQYVHIGLFTDENFVQVRTLATWARGEFVEDFTYTLSTPLSKKILEEQTILIPQAAVSLHPQDELFTALNIQSYLATQLISPSSTKCLGMLVVMDTAPITSTTWTTSVLELCAQQVAFETERDQSAQTLQQAKETCLAEIQQEIHIPANSILGMVELLLTTPLNAQQRRCVDTIHESVESLLKITHHTLASFTSTAPQLFFGFKNFELSVLLDDIVNLFATLAERKQVSLMYHISAKVPSHVRGPVNQLRQILTNLLSNAVKFTTKGEVLLRVTLLEEQAEKIQLRFEVKDTGRGFGEEVQTKIFQSSNGTDGLNITRQLVRKMGGELYLKSNIGQGSVFWITVWLEKSSWQQVHNVNTFYQQPILIVEDNNTQRQLLRAQTKTWGMQAIIAKSGAVAIEKLKKIPNQTINIAIVSYHLSDMDGITFAERCQEQADILAFPIILLTQISDQLDETALNACNIVAQLSKPLSTNRLYSILNHHLVTSLASKTIPEHCTHKSILVVDDSPMNRDVLVGMLKRLGYKSDIVKNGQEAIDILEEQTYHLIFMDCEMPILDGYAATREIRQREQTQNKPHTPIVALTAHALQECYQQSREAGMDDYLTKPLRLQTLRNTLAHWLMPKNPEEQAQIVEAQQETACVNDAVVTTKAIEPVDPKALRHLQEIIGEDTARLLSQQFVAYATQQLAAMQQSVRQNDNETLRRKAHQLKGESMQIGAIHLGNLCKNLESLAKSNRSESIKTCLVDIEAEIQRVNTTLIKMAYDSCE